VVATVTKSEDVLPFLRQGRVDLITPSSDLAPRLFDEGHGPALRLAREEELLPRFRHAPFLQPSGESFGACASSGAMALLEVSPDGSARLEWRALWDPARHDQVALHDDATWVVTVTALGLGLDPFWDLSDADLARVQAHQRRELYLELWEAAKRAAGRE
jgi:hypothetical protein